MAKKPKQCCELCRWEQFERTPTGRVSRVYSGRCGFPVNGQPPIVQGIPSSYRITITGPLAIWPEDGQYCPTYEAKE